MKFVTFGVDNNHSFVVIFSVFIKAFNTESLALNEIETVPVPISDLNEAANSYNTVIVSKPYLAINGECYIQLRMRELQMFKHIN